MDTNFDFVCDCHNDSILRIGDREFNSLVSPYNVTNAHRFLQIFAVFVENGSGRIRKSLQEYLQVNEDDLYGAVLKFADVYADTKYGDFKRCKNYKDVLEGAACSLNCGMLGLEGAGMIDSLSKLHEIYEKGVRFITLTWNHSNVIAAGCSSSGTREDYGLTQYGKEFVKECGKIGITVDISHASLNTMRGVLENACGPVIATHSNFRSVCDHARNLPDDVAKGIAEKGGFIGLNTYLPFVRENVSFKDYDPLFLSDHISYALKSGLSDFIGFGFDIDGVEEYAKGIDFSRSIHDQYLELLLNCGDFDPGTVYKIRCGNFMRFLRDSF